MTRHPNFFIVGAYKSGTTALHSYLASHPDIFMCPVKEPKYFGRDLRLVRLKRMTEEQYLALFSGAGEQRIVGEASPNYLQSKTAPEEISRFAPDARIVIMLRDPVEFMYSLHAQTVYFGDENIQEFEQALAAEPERRNGRSVPRTTGDVERLLYRECARFTDKVERYFDRFGRDRVKVILYDDFARDTKAAYDDVLQFLGVAPYLPPSFEVIHASKRPRMPALRRLIRSLEGMDSLRALRPLAGAVRAIESRVNTIPFKRPPMNPELEAGLRAEFAPEVERLGRLLNRDLSAWMHPRG